MKRRVIEKLGSLNNRATGNGLFRTWVVNRLRSLYAKMKRSLKNHEPASTHEQLLLDIDKRWRQLIAGHLTGKILVDLGVIKSEQLAEALKRQRELLEEGKRASLGVILVEMGYTSSKDYLEALSRYFGLRLYPC